MSLQLVKIAVRLTGGAGAGSGSATSTPSVSGYVEEVYLDYGQTAATTDVTIIEVGRSVPILTVSNNQTDGAYYPRAVPVTQANVTYTTAGGGGACIPIISPIQVSVAQGNDANPGVTAYVKVRTI